MKGKIIKVAAVVAFGLLCVLAFGNKKAWAYGVSQKGIADTSVTIDWTGTDTTTDYRIGYVQIPANANFETVTNLQNKAKANATNGQIKVAKGTSSYTITGLKPQAEYYIYLRSTYGGSNYESFDNLSGFTKIKKVANVAQEKWWKYIKQVDVKWDDIPSDYSSSVEYEVVFMNAKGKVIQKKKTTDNSFSHSIKNNLIYTIKVRATRTLRSSDYIGVPTETTAWSDVQYLFTQPTVIKSKLGGGKLTIQWNKIAGVTSYDVYVSTKQTSGYKKVKTLKASKNALTIKKFKKKKLTKKQYYVYVVPNKKVNGKVIKKDVTYTYRIQKGKNNISETYK